MRDGVQLTTGERIRIKADTATSTYSIKIKETQLEDAGVYCLVATNKEGETIGEIKLNVHSKKNYKLAARKNVFSIV